MNNNLCVKCGSKLEDTGVCNACSLARVQDLDFAQDERHFNISKSMGFIESIKYCYKNAFNFKGRASRSQYWWFQLYLSFAAVVLGFIFAADLYDLNTLEIIIFLSENLTFKLLLTVIVFPALATSVRRLHDVNKSGFWYLLSLIPFGVFALLFLFCKESYDVSKIKPKYR